MINDRQLRRYRTKAGFRFGDGKSIDLLRFVAWAFEQKQSTPAEQEPEVDGENPYVVRTQTAVAKFFCVSYDTIKTWSRNEMPHKRNAYDLSAIACWLLDRRFQNATPADGEASRRQLEMRKLQAEVDKIERANAEADGMLVDRRSVEAQVGQLLIELKKSFERLPARIQTALPRELEGTLLPEFRRLIHHTLHEVAQRLQEFCSPAPEAAADMSQDMPATS